MAPIELGGTLLEQQVLLEAVAVMLLEMAGGGVFLLLPGNSGKKLRSIVGGYRE